MNHLIIGTAGHVDHGKTTLIKALTGFDCDTHKEEKDRGITINPGFSHLDLPGGDSIGIVDVPGHKDFIKNMLAGAHGIDMVILVIAADSGIMPQTTEHMKIIEMLGVEKGIIALTKIDIVDEETRELAKLEIMDFLEGSKLKNAPLVSISPITGEGIDELITEIEKLGESITRESENEDFRLYIDRLFNVKGIGFVVTGTVINGELHSGKDVFLLPGKGKKLRVKGIERHGKQVDKVVAGDRAAINISGIKQDDFERGMILSGKELDSTNLIDASIGLFENNLELGVWSNVIFYSGTIECMARMHLLDKDKVGNNESAIVQLHLEKPAILFNKDKFIIRNSSSDLTLGGGTIIDNNPLHHRKRTRKLIADLKALEKASLSDAGILDLALIHLKKENKPMLLDEVAKDINKDPEELQNEINTSKRTDIRIYGSSSEKVLIDGSLDDECINNILEELKNWHSKYPLFHHGMDNKALFGKLGFGKNQAGQQYLDAILEKMNKENLVAKHKSTWVLPDHKVIIDQKMQDQIDWVEHKLLSYGMEKPLMTELEASAKHNDIPGDKLKMFLIYLSQQGKIYYNQTDVIHNNILEQCRYRLLDDIKDKERGINEKEFRELINGTKKLVQMLLAIFISEGIVFKEKFFIYITETGKKVIND